MQSIQRLEVVLHAFLLKDKTDRKDLSPEWFCKLTPKHRAHKAGTQRGYTVVRKGTTLVINGTLYNLVHENAKHYNILNFLFKKQILF